MAEENEDWLDAVPSPFMSMDRRLMPAIDKSIKESSEIKNLIATRRRTLETSSPPKRITSLRMLNIIIQGVRVTNGIVGALHNEYFYKLKYSDYGDKRANEYIQEWLIRGQNCPSLPAQDLSLIHI